MTENNPKFPFLFGGTFIEVGGWKSSASVLPRFPFLFGGTFIEVQVVLQVHAIGVISLPFRRDFH